MRSQLLAVSLGVALSATATIAAQTPESKTPSPPELIKIGPNGEIETPQAKIDAQGNVQVADMKFLPNGDILGSDGKKLYDADKKLWASGLFVEGPGVPVLRLGDTFEQCTARYGQPSENFGAFYFTDSGWTLEVKFRQGMAEHVSASRQHGLDAEFKKSGTVVIELNPPSKQEVQAFQQLHGVDRDWEQIDSSNTVIRQVTAGNELVVTLPEVKWRTKDGLLHLEYEAYDVGRSLRESFSVSTVGYQERKKRTSDLIKMNRDDSRTAWELGASITMLAGSNSKEVRDAMRDIGKAFTSIRATQPARAKDPSLALWELPGTTGDLQKDRKAMDKFLTSLSDRILKSLGMDDITPEEPGIAGCFELGRITPLISLVLRANDPKWKAEFLDQFAAAGRKSNLPKELWEPVLEKARTEVPIADEVLASSAKMFKDVTAYLDAKRAEWKPPKVETEK